MLRGIERIIGALFPHLKIAAALVHSHACAERHVKRRTVRSGLRNVAEIRDQPRYELLNLAEKGSLSNPTVLTAQVNRMLEDRRSKAFVLLANIKHEGLLTEEELTQFSPEARNAIDDIESITTRIITR